jgi:GTPase involved in cell partitioning and DNA repair
VCRIHYKNAEIQLLDLPGIIEGASQGKGRGRQVIAVAKTSDLIIMMLDASKSNDQKRLLEIELEAVGIRINVGKPNIYCTTLLLICSQSKERRWNLLQQHFKVDSSYRAIGYYFSNI